MRLVPDKGSAARLEHHHTFFGAPLPVAVRTGSLTIVDILLTRMRLHSRMDIRSEALRVAAESGHSHILSRFLNISGFIEFQTHSYDTAVLAALANNRDGAMLLLLKNRSRFAGNYGKKPFGVCFVGRDSDPFWKHNSCEDKFWKSIFSSLIKVTVANDWHL